MWGIWQPYNGKAKYAVGGDTMNKLREAITAKTKCDVTDELYHEALEAAKVEIQEHQENFKRKSKAERLEYVEYKMAVYCIMVILRI